MVKHGGQGITEKTGNMLTRGLLLAVNEDKSFVFFCALEQVHNPTAIVWHVFSYCAAPLVTDRDVSY